MPGPEPAVQVSALGNGVFRITNPDGTARAAYGVADGPRTWVFLDGLTYVIDATPSRRSAAGHDDAALAAPMPATVTQIHVATGQKVAKGDVLLTLEAMKMELAIRSPHDATVAAVHCKQGDLVQPGVPLIDLAENPEA